jgi:hypothetical protein
MTIPKRTGRLLLATVATTAAVVSLCAASALASTPRATTLTVKVSGGGTFTATASKTVLSETVDGVPVTVTCKSKGKTPASSAKGDIPNGTVKGASPVKVGTTKDLTFNNCTGPLGAVHTKVEAEPYKVSIDSKTNSKGETDGEISGVKVHVTMTGCAFNVTGASPGYYTNGKHTLTMSSKLPVKSTTKAELTISGVAAGTCAGIIKNGQHPGFSSTFTLSRKGTIKSS